MARRKSQGVAKSPVRPDHNTKTNLANSFCDHKPRKQIEPAKFAFAGLKRCDEFSHLLDVIIDNRHRSPFTAFGGAITICGPLYTVDDNAELLMSQILDCDYLCVLDDWNTNAECALAVGAGIAAGKKVVIKRSEIPDWLLQSVFLELKTPFDFMAFLNGFAKTKTRELLCESEPELRFFDYISSIAAFEGFVPQVTVEPVDGRKFRLDFANERLKVAVEIDGYEFHSDRNAFRKDRSRDRDLTGAGWTVLRIAASEVLDENLIHRAVGSVEHVILNKLEQMK